MIQNDGHPLSLVQTTLERISSLVSISQFGSRKKKLSAKRLDSAGVWRVREAERIWAEPADAKYLGWESISSQARTGCRTFSVWWPALGDFS